jgi:hypothetical protein
MGCKGFVNNFADAVPLVDLAGSSMCLHVTPNKRGIHDCRPSNCGLRRVLRIMPGIAEEVLTAPLKAEIPAVSLRLVLPDDKLVSPV